MTWSIRIGRIRGTEIKVHITFLLLLGFYAYAYYQAGGPAAALDATLFLLALFACVLLHEFGHILMAGHFGVRTPDVILLPIGGVARLERVPEEPRQELLIAAAGPVVTLLIAVALGSALLIAGQSVALFPLSLDTGAFGARLLAANVWVLLFNLLPAFPMDGGRMFRALLAWRLGLGRATKIAASVGQALAAVMGLYGLFAGGGPILALIALFIFLGAGAEASAVETRAAGRGLAVTQMMVTDFRTVPVYATLQQAVELLLAGEQREFPVLDNLGRVEGLLTRDNLIRGLSERGPASAVSDAMTTRIPAVSPSLGFEQALGQLRTSGLPALPVVDTMGKLVGLLTMDNISDLLLIRRARREV